MTNNKLSIKNFIPSLFVSFSVRVFSTRTFFSLSFSACIILCHCLLHNNLLFSLFLRLYHSLTVCFCTIGNLIFSLFLLLYNSLPLSFPQEPSFLSLCPFYRGSVSFGHPSFKGRKRKTAPSLTEVVIFRSARKEK